MLITPADYESEETLLDRPVRYSLDLEPAEYAGLCRIICARRVSGRKVSMRELIRSALHASYPETLTAQPGVLRG